jgi:hypothetical protein
LRRSVFFVVAAIILLSFFRSAFPVDFKTAQTKNFNIHFQEDLTAADLGAVKDLFESAHEDMVGHLGDIVPKPTDVVIFSSCGDFTYHTKLPWWSASAMSGGVIYLQPISILKQRGVLKNVIRHEVALVFIHHKWGEAAPVWFAEGLSVYYSGEIEILKREAIGDRPKVDGVDDIDGLLRDHSDRNKNRWGYILAYEEVLRLMENDDWEFLPLNP